MPMCEIILADKYKNPEDEANFALGKIYLKKLGTNIFKLSFYIFMTIFGYYILSQVDYFPKELLGSGDMWKIWEPGHPNSYYYWKPDYFDIYYLLGLAFCFTDLIWLIFIYELQTDFTAMLLHHLCTIGLIAFSFLTNTSHIGSLILFLHDIGDIFVYISRIIINFDVKKYIILSGVLLLSVFIYTRLYVFAKLLYSVYLGANWPWKWVISSLFCFACFLYIMHINWVLLIAKKFHKALFKNKYEDIARIKNQESFKNK